jgi:para-nitrobenzyl esterase
LPVSERLDAEVAGGVAPSSLLWFPSGGNFTGASSDARYQSLSIPQHGVILVSAQYRLSIFGFLAHPALSAESPHHASGNYGLLDIIAAMHDGEGRHRQ